MKSYRLSSFCQCLLACISFVIVALGQPAWVPLFAPLAAAFGYALFFRILLAYPSAKQRFYLGTAWFFCIQLLQLSWFLSHPYSYIYGVYFALSLWLGLQFGLLSLCITPNAMTSWLKIFGMAGLWTIFEWSRLFVLAGFSWNPAGLALSANLYSLQAASVAGTYGLTFWVMLANLTMLRLYMTHHEKPAHIKRASSLLLASFVALVPYIFGFLQLSYHAPKMAALPPSLHFHALLVQTAFAPEELEGNRTRKNPIQQALEEWQAILATLRNHSSSRISLIALPESVVPFGAYAFAYPLHEVLKAFHDILGKESLKALPSPQYPLASYQRAYDSKEGSASGKILVSNAFIAQGIANFFNTPLLAGLEDAEDTPHRERLYYGAALLFSPYASQDKQQEFSFPKRYAKRVLVPMGEYIPFAFCRELARGYGIQGSLTPGSKACTMDACGIPFSPSICYEETFGHIVRESKSLGACLLVNITNDAWYPSSRLMQQHCDLARLRTVENGLPLMRSCNTGITCSIDSLGRMRSILGGKDPLAAEWQQAALLATVPLYTYPTLYGIAGDLLIIALSFAVIFLEIIRQLIIKLKK